MLLSLPSLIPFHYKSFKKHQNIKNRYLSPKLNPTNKCKKQHQLPNNQDTLIKINHLLKKLLSITAVVLIPLSARKFQKLELVLAKLGNFIRNQRKKSNGSFKMIYRN
jgi:hypothetical protein